MIETCHTKRFHNIIRWKVKIKTYIYEAEWCWALFFSVGVTLETSVVQPLSVQFWHSLQALWDWSAVRHDVLVPIHSPSRQNSLIYPGPKSHSQKTWHQEKKYISTFYKISKTKCKDKDAIVLCILKYLREIFHEDRRKLRQRSNNGLVTSSPLAAVALQDPPEQIVHSAHGKQAP